MADFQIRISEETCAKIRERLKPASSSTTTLVSGPDGGVPVPPDGTVTVDFGKAVIGSFNFLKPTKTEGGVNIFDGSIVNLEAQSATKHI